jgi:undecaprenyl-diphosphatase
LTYLQAIVLGIVQGLTEFLPVSSSGHLAITQRLMSLEPNSPAMLIFNVTSHVATLVAVLLVFAVTIRRFFFRLAAELRGEFQGRRTGWRIALIGALATIPVAVVGVVWKSDIESAFDNPKGIGIALLVTSVLLWSTAVIPRGRRGWRRFGWGRALVVGLAQAGAIMPGVSRSGSTIATALLVGLRRRWAAQFSFLIAVPAIFGAALIKAKDALELVSGGVLLPWGPIVAGSLASLVTGYAALAVLLRIVDQRKFHWFGFYTFVLGVLILMFL